MLWVSPNISVYLSQVYTRLSPLSYFRPSVTCVSTGEAARVAPISTAKAEWRPNLYDTEACWLVLIQLSASLVNIMTRQALEGKASSDLAVSLFNQLKGAVVSHAKNTGHRTLHSPAQATRDSVLSRRICELHILKARQRTRLPQRYCDADVQILIYLKDDESPYHTVDNRPKGLANAAG